MARCFNLSPIAILSKGMHMKDHPTHYVLVNFDIHVISSDQSW